MRFISQKKINDCGYCVIKFILKNYKNINFNTKITTKNIPLSTISILLGGYLVDNLIKFCDLDTEIDIGIFPTILHLKKIIGYHYIVVIKKVNSYLLIYDPSSIGFKYVLAKRIYKKWTGYFIEMHNCKSFCVSNKFYLPTIIYIFIKCFLIFSLILSFYIYWKIILLLVQ